MIKFKDEEVQELYKQHMNELEELKELLNEVGTPYAILKWWHTTEYNLTWTTFYRYRIDAIKLTAVIENEVQTILHKHFADDTIVEYREMFSQYGLVRMKDNISDAINNVADKCESIRNSVYNVSSHLGDIEECVRYR